jgi:type IV secretion system protein VirD4
MIDEFPSLGKLDVFAESLAYVAGYGIKMYLICQDTAQLYAAYGKDESIIANCHVRVVYAPNRVETAEWLSKILGKKTLVTENTTFSYNGQFLPYQTGMSGGLQYQGRELLTTEEVMSLRGPTKDARGNILVPGAMITLVAGKAPVYGTQMLYFKDPVFQARAQIPPPDGAAPVEKGDSAAPAGGVEAIGEARNYTSAAPTPAVQKLDLDALDALESENINAKVSTPHKSDSALLMDAADKDDQSRAKDEITDMARVLDLLSANTEVLLREQATDADNRNHNPEINDYGAVELAKINQDPPPSRTREHRLLDKRGFAMILGVER